MSAGGQEGGVGVATMRGCGGFELSSDPVRGGHGEGKQEVVLV